MIKHGVRPAVRALTHRFTRENILVLWVLIGLLVCGGVSQSRAQITVPEVQSLRPAVEVETGVELLRKGQPAEAVSVLRRAMATDSALTSPSHGAAAYWLGEAHVEAGAPDKARDAWQSGLRALRAIGAFDVRLADAYLRHLTPAQLRGERLYAADVYRTLLERVRPDTVEAVQAVFRRRVAQIAPLMSEQTLGRVINEARTAESDTWTFQPDAGGVLDEWWRGLDPFPATDENERLEEHMVRLVHVQQEYRCPARTSTFDPRGTVYLRFGAPYKLRRLDYEDGEFFRDVYRFGVHIPPSGFPRSEIWLYTHIDEAGYYLFAESDTSDCFTMAQANDLIPDYLTQHRPDTKRGLNIAYSALMAMRAIYRELAVYHINFSGRYTDIANYVGWQETKATAVRAAERTPAQYRGAAGEQSTVVGAGIGQTRRIFENPMMGIDFPNDFVARLTSRAEREDRAAAERRKEAMPRQYTALFEDASRLPVAVRTARFLNPSGTTRTEVYWGVPAASLRLKDEDSVSAGASLISFSVVRYGPSHRSEQQKRRRYRINIRQHPGEQMIVLPPVTLGGTNGMYHLGMQWEQYELWERDSASLGSRSLGRMRRIATARSDSLSSLHSAGDRLEMSDIRVMMVPDTSEQTLAQPMSRAQPYPFRSLSPDRPLLLFFEVYHLARDADKRTRYTISYEAEGQTRRGWKEIFLGDDTRRTSTAMTMQGSDRRTQEAILLDLSTLSKDEPQDVRVSVQVTDEVTGETVSRSVDFVLRPKDGSN